MSTDRAVIEAELQGAGKVKADAKGIGTALRDSARVAGGDLSSGLTTATGRLSAATSQISALRGALNPSALIGGAVGGAVFGLVLEGVSRVRQYLSEAAQQARSFNDATSQTARRAGLDLGGLRAEVARDTVEALQGSDAQLEFVDAVQRGSYAGRQADADLRGMGQVAKLSGQDLRGMAGTFSALQQGLGLKQDVSGEIQRLRDEAERLQTVGGPQGLLDTITALRPALLQAGGEASEARTKLEALGVLLSKRFTPEQAAGIAGSAVSFVQGKAMQIAFTLGKNLTDIIDPTTGMPRDAVGTVQELQQRFKKRFKSQERRVRGYYGEGFSPQEVALLESGALEETRFETAVLQGNRRLQQITGQTAEHPGFEAYQHSSEGLRETVAARETARQLRFGEPTLAAKDALAQATESAISGPLAPSGPGAAQDPHQAETLAHLRRIADNTATLTPTSLRAAVSGAKVQVQIPVNPNAAPGNP